MDKCQNKFSLGFPGIFNGILVFEGWRERGGDCWQSTFGKDFFFYKDLFLFKLFLLHTMN